VKIVVCVKEILDPDIASSVFRVDEAARAVISLPGQRTVMSPFDEQAIEVALRIRDALREASIVLLSQGAESARAILKHGLALGADEAILLCDPAFEGGDSYTTARALAAAIRRLGDVDLVVAGRQAADDDDGVVGCGIAELLGIPAVTFAMDVAVVDGMVVVERSLGGDGAETVAAPMPALVTVSHEVGKVRHASLRETMKAARKPLHTWTPGDLGLAPSEVGAQGARRVLERLYIPVTDIECEYIGGGSPAEIAASLVDRLAAARLIRVRGGSPP
jgi:electron transfer flavoprotein beta subunit